jgi:pimeloyl-ACP methyl ester carboxylesterase
LFVVLYYLQVHAAATNILKVNGGRLQYIDVSGDSPVVVLHGSPGGADQGKALGRFLADAGMRVIAPSRPGYLETDLALGAEINEQAKLIKELLDRLEIERVALMSWSGGGPAMYRFGALYPERVTKLVAFSAVSTTYKMHSEGKLTELLLSSKLGTGVISGLLYKRPEQVIQSTLKAEGDLSARDLKRLSKAAASDPDQLSFMKELIATTNYLPDRRRGFKNDRRCFKKIKSLELDKIKAPALLAHSPEDTDVPFSQSEFAASHLASAELVTLERGTHLSGWIHPNAKKLQEKVVSFLK